jgi:poly-gamma-glutamate synthesis protein (capsule biosynthesis protein)
MTFDLEIRGPFDRGAYRLPTATGNRGPLSRMVYIPWVVFAKRFFSPRLMGTKVRSASFQELAVISPENAERRVLDRHHKRSVPFDLDLPASEGERGNGSRFAYPFQKIAPLFQNKDLVLVNLETPLTEHRRAQGFFISDPRYAQAMKEAGISMVSVANNHIFDAGEIGFVQTLGHLEEAGILVTGGGSNLEDARAGSLIKLDGISVVSLGYTQFCNSGYSSVAAEYPGILPLDRQLIVEDIKKAKDRADLVFVCLHWGFENQPNVHPDQVEIAHLLIDAGADAIIGHHPHVPHAIEVYKKRPILYSLGNLIFGHASEGWSDNYVAEIIIEQGRIGGVVIHPVSGQGEALFQPAPLTGAQADALLHELQVKSEVFGTGIAIQDHRGYVGIE